MKCMYSYFRDRNFIRKLFYHSLFPTLSIHCILSFSPKEYIFQHPWTFLSFISFICEKEEKSMDGSMIRQIHTFFSSFFYGMGLWTAFSERQREKKHLLSLEKASFHRPINNLTLSLSHTMKIKIIMHHFSISFIQI